jgi:hypothetical protein
MAFFTSQAMKRMAKSGFPTPMDAPVEVTGMGQTDPLATALQTVLKPVTGALTQEAFQQIDPLMEKMRPFLRDELTRQVPTFAIYSGIAMGVLVLIGIYTGILTQKERKQG